MKINKIILLAVVLISIFIMTTANSQTIQTLGEFKRGEDIRLTQSHPNATYINISEITNPNGQIVLSDLEMTKIGTVYNYTVNSTINQNWVLGNYLVRGVSDGNPFIFVYDFDLVRGGRWAFNLNNNNFLVGFIILVIVLIGLMIFKQYTTSGLIVVILGFILLFNEVAWWICVPIIIAGVGLVAKGSNIKE